MSTPPEGGTPAVALKTEAAELKQDIKEATTDAQAARVAGDDARADRLEASIAAQQKTLDTIMEELKQLRERPFHPAPGDSAPAAGGAPSGDEKPAAGGAPAGDSAPAAGSAPAGDEKPRRRHWLYGDRWNQE